MILLASFWARLTALPGSYLALWAVLAALTVGLVALMRSRWGRHRPTHRYVLLSVVGHLLLICLAMTVRFLSGPVGEESTSPVRVRIVMRSAPPAKTPEPAAALQQPTPAIVESPPPPLPIDAPEPRQEHTAAEAIEVPPLPDPPVEVAPPPPTELPNSTPPPETPPETQPETPPETPPVELPPAETAAEETPPTDLAAVPTAPAEIASTELTPLDSPPAAPPITTPIVAPAPTPIQKNIDSQPAQPSPQPTIAAPTWQSGVTQPVLTEGPPTPYGARTRDERWRLVEQEGGSRATEDAVAAALAWLAASQSRDGRWDADRWAAGREQQVFGEDRRSAGVRADMGITGLATLAMMGAGHSHFDGGPYANSIRAALEFLLRSQRTDGGLAGDATLFAQTYCHSMATFALAEALAETRDERLHQAVSRAVNYLITRQHQATGGWRYRPGQPGDMSQMGWVIMALRSAELGGVDVPPSAWAGIERFVDSVRRGQQGGLACYRRDGPVSRTMTAEALYCRQILGVPVTKPAGDEAITTLLAGPPGSGQANLYYWYYATLALHHHRNSGGLADTAWRTWNEALTRSLTTTQVRDGQNAGSWSPNTLWGGYGGRVYSTAMATMCLEVYYRYDPQQLIRDPWIAARPGGRSLR